MPPDQPQTLEAWWRQFENRALRPMGLDEEDIVLCRLCFHVGAVSILALAEDQPCTVGDVVAELSAFEASMMAKFGAWRH